ncbi:MAG TPA: response regulator [Anaerolineae bacterium]|nr:response regulator [Anaerolineae bacterium]
MTKGSVLIVPADDTTLDLLRAYFASAEYAILIAHSKEEALHLARQSLPQAIIVDLDVPDVDVAALCQEIRSSPRTQHIHITLLTPHARHDDRLTALSSGADEFLPKPVDAEELGLRVRNALRRAEFQNLVDPVTGLPGSRLVEEQLRALLRRKQPWAFVRANLRGFKAFSTAYGFLAGEEVLRFVAQTLTHTVDESGTHDDFLGHAGGDNFVVITTLDRGDPIRQSLVDQVNTGVLAHYSFRERERGYLILKDADGTETQAPLMTLNAQLLTSEQGPFYDIMELTQLQ